MDENETILRDFVNELPAHLGVNQVHYLEFFRRLGKPEHANQKAELLGAYQHYIRVMEQVFYVVHPKGAQALGLQPTNDAIHRNPPKFTFNQTVYIASDRPPCRFIFGLELVVKDIIRAKDESTWLYHCQRADVGRQHRWYKVREEWLSAE